MAINIEGYKSVAVSFSLEALEAEKEAARARSCGEPWPREVTLLFRPDMPREDVQGYLDRVGFQYSAADLEIFPCAGEESPDDPYMQHAGCGGELVVIGEVSVGHGLVNELQCEKCEKVMDSTDYDCFEGYWLDKASSENPSGSRV